MAKIDLKKELKHLYRPKPGEFTVVEVPEMAFTKIDGEGSPGGDRYLQSLAALYPVAYRLLSLSKRVLDIDYVVPPLEGLWWAEDMAAFVDGDRDAWKWTLMIMQPQWITEALFVEAVDEVAGAKNPDFLDRVRFETYEEGLAVQTLHVGSFADEAPVIHELHTGFLPEHGLVENGVHHEIYLSNPARVAPEKLKTVLRQPVRRS